MLCLAQFTISRTSQAMLRLEAAKACLISDARAPQNTRPGADSGRPLTIDGLDQRSGARLLALHYVQHSEHEHTHVERANLVKSVKNSTWSRTS